MSLRAASIGLLSKVAPRAAERVSDAMTSVDRAAEHVRRLFGSPSPIWRTPKTWRRFPSEEAARLLVGLHHDGLVTLPGFLDPQQLLRVHAALDSEFSASAGSKMDYRPSQKYYACLQPLALCAELADAAIDSDLLNLVGAYFRRKPFLAEADFRRVLPLDLVAHERENEKFAKGYSSSHWHHDIHGHELKAMIYLTDVGPGDQNFAFLRGSHRGFRSARYEKSRFTDRQVEKMGHTIVECYAPAGAIIIFDSNGIHRLRRLETRVRDSVTFYYHPGRVCHKVPLVVHPDSLARHRAEFFRVASVAL